MPMMSAHDFFRDKATDYPTESAAHELATGLADGSLTPSVTARVASTYGLRREDELTTMILDWLLELSRLLLGQTPPVADLAEVLSPLKHRLSIREGDFYHFRGPEIRDLLTEQLDLVLADGIVDDHEELTLARLQRAFDLGYDQYLGLMRPRYERALAEVNARLAAASADDRRQMERRTLALRSICELAMSQPRSLGGRR